MEKVALRLYAMDAVILMLRNLVPERDILHEWKRHRIKTASLDHSESGKSGRESNIRLQRKVDEVLNELEAAPNKTVLVTDDPHDLHKVRRLKLGMKVAVAPLRRKKRFYENGADVVINSFDEISMSGGGNIDPRFSQNLPNVFSDLSKFHTFLGDRKPVFFFDYDGTLAPIVNDPAEAVIDDNIRELLKNIAEIYPVAVVSGRDMDDIRSFIGLDSIIYAGSHGFRISGPDNLHMENQEAASMRSGLDSLEEQLIKELEATLKGVQVERKLYAIAVHYRNAPPGTSGKVRKYLTELVRKHPEYNLDGGKKIYEIKPAIDWHKGKAIEWILNELDMDPNTEYCPVYLGDDLTDEDAFKTLVDNGLGILVGDHGQPSAAHYQLKNVGQVRQFLHHLLISAVRLV